MLEKSYYHKYEPCDENNRYENKTNKYKDKSRRYKCIYDKAEIEINNFKTCFFFESWELIFLNKIVENDEKESECTAWEEIRCEMKDAKHLHTLGFTRIC